MQLLLPYRPNQNLSLQSNEAGAEVAVAVVVGVDQQVSRPLLQCLNRQSPLALSLAVSTLLTGGLSSQDKMPRDANPHRLRCSQQPSCLCLASHR